MIAIKDLLDPTLISEAIKVDPKLQLPWFSPTVFPEKRTPFYELSFLKGSRGISALSRLSSFDADYTYLDRGGLTKQTVELPFNREAFRLGERERRRLNELLQAGNLEGARQLVENIYDDIRELIERAHTFREYTAMKILQNASVTVASTQDSNVRNYTITYDPDGTWAASNIINATTAWETPAANPLVDIISAIRYARELNGTVISKILLSSRLYNALLVNDSVRQTIAPNYQQFIVGSDNINDYLSAKIGGNLEVIDFAQNYRSTYANEASNLAPTPFLAANRVILLPQGNIGNTHVATTPAEDAKAYDPSLNISTIENVTINQEIEKASEPFVYKTIASQAKLQSFEQMDSVFNIQVP